ncbi:MAG: TetR/AcrR family transcriptional regulator [Alphaproteobacteria bacterium]|nr:TetR/AcrR family transcriptional regulator [Alphaproteobacteria bacterium]
MAQVKKEIVREAILRAAFDLFSKQDYADTSLADIARKAGVATSSLYVYFPSKFKLFWAVLRPWLVEQMDALEQSVRPITDPRGRLERILYVLWGEIPAANNNLAMNLVRGVALSGPNDRDSRDTLLYLENRLAGMFRDCLPMERQTLMNRNNTFSQLAILTFDGLVVTSRLGRSVKRLDDLVRIAILLLLGNPDVPTPAIARQSYPCYDALTCG